MTGMSDMTVAWAIAAFIIGIGIGLLLVSKQ